MNDELLKDSRFSHIPRDPKFRRIPKHERKIKIDKRFQSMFKDKNFSVKYTIDKRGRPMNHTSSEDLKKYYELSSSSDDDGSNDDEDESEENTLQTENTERKSPSKKIKLTKKATEKSVKKNTIESIKEENQIVSGNDLSNKLEGQEDGEEYSHSNGSDVTDTSDIDETIDSENEKQLNMRQENEDKNIGKNIKKKLRDMTVDYARGEGVLLSDSSSDEESSEEEVKEEIEHYWGELDIDAETTDEITSRLAVCHMDWDKIRAVDLMVLFNSFLPPGGMIHSVKIYPSEFGKERMKNEEIKGPTELADWKTTTDNVNDGDDKDESQYIERMRKFQINRLKYYYAVVTCDCPETANKIYTDLDNIEYESTASKFDLRFIPEDMTFDDKPREVCEKLPELSKYQPRQFVTTALQQVKVAVTWDETNPERIEMAKKLNSGKIDDIDQNDIKTYLASGSSDDESENDENNEEKDDSAGSEVDENDGKDPIEKYRSLLKLIEDKEQEEEKKKIELEYSWDIGAKEKTEKLVKEKMKKLEQMTPFEKYLEKRKEKKKAKKDKKANKDNINRQDSLDSDDSIPSDVDMNDPYFAEEMKKSTKKSKKPEENDQLIEKDDEKQTKAELELLMLDVDEKNKSHFNMKDIENAETLTKSKKKRLTKKQKIQKESVAEDNFKVDVTDPRFDALFTSHHYNIDPADPHYRNTPGTTALIDEQLKRRANKIDEEVPKKQAKNDELNTDLAALVKAVKKNTKNNISKRIK